MTHPLPQCVPGPQKHWGFSSFRPHQREAIEAALAGQDVFVCMATSSGKSLCFQVLALVSGKVTFVVSPLVSLMQDQVMRLQQ